MSEERTQNSEPRTQNGIGSRLADSPSSSNQSAGYRRRRQEAGAATIEYFLILGLVTGMIIAFLGFLFPGGSRNFETLINAWGNRLATHIAGDKIDANSDGITDQ